MCSDEAHIRDLAIYIKKRSLGPARKLVIFFFFSLYTNQKECWNIVLYCGLQGSGNKFNLKVPVFYIFTCWLSKREMFQFTLLQHFLSCQSAMWRLQPMFLSLVPALSPARGLQYISLDAHLQMVSQGTVRAQPERTAWESCHRDVGDSEESQCTEGKEDVILLSG